MAGLYREALGRGIDPIVARDLAAEIYIAQGGARDGAGETVGQMLQSVAGEHGAWLSGPVKARIERGNAALQALGWWPPPKRADVAEIWAEEAIRRLSAPPPDEAEVARRLAARHAENSAWLERKRAEIREGGGETHQPGGASGS